MMQQPYTVRDIKSSSLDETCMHGDCIMTCLPSSALPFLKDSLIWAEAFFTPAAVRRERQRVKMMSGGRRLALIINHLVLLSSAVRLLLVS